MQRKSTRKTTSHAPEEDKEEVSTVEEGTRSLREIKNSVFADQGLRNFFTIVKYSFIILIILPWLIQINSKVKENDVLPKLQHFFLNSFKCPEIAFNCSNCNCTTVDKTQTPSSSL